MRCHTISTAVREYRAVPVGGRGAKGRERASRHATWRRADGLYALDPISQTQSQKSCLVRSRPLRAVGGARIDAALQPVASHRIRSFARRHQAVPAVGQQDARPSRTRPYARRRDHDGPARAGFQQRGRYGRSQRRALRRVTTVRDSTSSTTPPTSSRAMEI